MTPAITFLVIVAFLAFVWVFVEAAARAARNVPRKIAEHAHKLQDQHPGATVVVTDEWWGRRFTVTYPPPIE